MTTPYELPQPFRDNPFLVSEARAANISESQLRAQHLAKPYWGARVPSQVLTYQEAVINECLAYLPLLRTGQFFSHTTAARLWRLPLPREFDHSYQPVPGEAPDLLHVSSSTLSRPRRPGVIGHRVNAGYPVMRRLGMPASSAIATWLELAAILQLDDLIESGDALVRIPYQLDLRDPRPFAGIDDLASAVAQCSGRGMKNAAAALALVREGSDSPRETRLRLMLHRAGLPRPLLNVNVTTRDGKWLGRGDLVWEEWRTLTEYDGEQHRTNDMQYARDERRIENFVHADWNVVRVRKSGLVGAGRQDTIDRVTRALSAGGWRG